MSNERHLGLGLRLFSYCVRVPLVGLCTILCGTLSLLSSLVDSDGHLQHGFARLWSWLILKVVQCPVQTEGFEKIDASKPAIYASNHLSLIDTPCLFWHMPFQFRIMAKKELFGVPFMGWHLRRSGQIPIDRTSARASLLSLTKAMELLKGGMNLVVFPEGGRSHNGQVQPFLGGVFYAAIKAGVPIVPMAMIGNFEALPMNNYAVAPRTLLMRIGDPVSTEGFVPRDMEKLAAIVQKKVEDLYYEYSDAADPRTAIEEPAAQ